jgi:hypothetical protein
MKKLLSLVFILAAALIGLVACEASQGSGSAPRTESPAASGAASGPAVLPVTKNPITNTGTKTGLAISETMVENNVDKASGKEVSDRLQFTLKNSSAEEITGVEVYYTMTETPSGKTESYYQKLDGLTIAPNKEATVYFDNESGEGHYPENKFSIYRTSPEEVKFDIEASAPGFAAARGTAVKEAGLEEAD